MKTRFSRTKMAGICIYMVDVHPPCSQATSVVVLVSCNFPFFFGMIQRQSRRRSDHSFFVYIPLLLFCKIISQYADGLST